MAREDVKRRLELAEAKRAEAAARHEGIRKQLEELEEQRNAALGEVELAQRAISDYERVVEQARQELDAFALEEARTAFAEAAEARDRLLEQTARDLSAALAGLEALDASRAAVEDAHQRLASLDASVEGLPDEPDVLHEPWQRMLASAKAELEGELDSELVDAAVRSNRPTALGALPEHLREVAVRRRRELRLARMQELHNRVRERESGSAAFDE